MNFECLTCNVKFNADSEGHVDLQLGVGMCDACHDTLSPNDPDRQLFNNDFYEEL